MKPHRKTSKRKGVAAVEFAMVAPIVFFLIFTIFELARLILFSGNVNTALLTGARQATLQSSTAAEVEETIRTELRRLGITEVDIVFSPAEFTSIDSELQIDVSVPVVSSFAINLTEINRGLTITRE